MSVAANCLTQRKLLVAQCSGQFFCAQPTQTPTQESRLPVTTQTENRLSTTHKPTHFPSTSPSRSRCRCAPMVGGPEHKTTHNPPKRAGFRSLRRPKTGSQPPHNPPKTTPKPTHFPSTSPSRSRCRCAAGAQPKKIIFIMLNT